MVSMENPPEHTPTDGKITEEADLALALGPQHKEVVGNTYLAVLIIIS